MISVKINSSVEGGKLGLKSRQFYLRPPRVNKKLKKMVYPYKLGIRSEVEVLVELSEISQAIDKGSMLNVGDAIQGETIEGFSTKPIAKPILSKGSAAHSANFAQAKGHAFAKLIIPPREHLEKKTQ